MKHTDFGLIEDGYQMELDFSMTDEPVPSAVTDIKESVDEKGELEQIPKGCKRARELRIGDKVLRPQDEKLVISSIRDTGRYIYVTFLGGVTVPYRPDNTVKVSEK